MSPMENRGPKRVNDFAEVPKQIRGRVQTRTQDTCAQGLFPLHQLPEWPPRRMRPHCSHCRWLVFIESPLEQARAGAGGGKARQAPWSPDGQRPAGPESSDQHQGERQATRRAPPGRRVSETWCRWGVKKTLRLKRKLQQVKCRNRGLPQKKKKTGPCTRAHLPA